MTDQPSRASSPVVRYVLVAYLIGSFLWRVLTPAHEYASRGSVYLEIALDILVVAGLVAIRAQLPKPLFWIALAAGLGLLALRLNGDAGWWTGHLVYSLSPR